MPFDSPDVNLGQLLAEIHTGKTQLPDFQRDWKWDTDHIESLLASISLGYPVGVVMMLEVGGEDVRFAPRAVSGAEGSVQQAPVQLILDGQQRLTSLYQSLYSGNVVNTADAKKKKLQRWYYVDIDLALRDDIDREEAILAVPADRKRRDNFGRDIVADFSTTELECRQGVFPLGKLFDAASIFAWQNAYLAIDPDDSAARSERWIEFYNRVLQNLIGYTVPVIILKKETPKEAVCTVFEKVNTGGVALNVFELLTATFASDNFDLRADWDDRRNRLAEHKVLRGIENTDFLQTVTLLATKARQDVYLASGADPNDAPGISARRREVLRLRLSEYQEWADRVEAALLWCASFLAGERIFQSGDVPYRTQLVPLAAIRAALGDAASTQGASERIRQWFWCGVLGELYGGTTETRFARDLADVVAWLKDGPLPNTINDAAFNPDRLLTLRTRNSAAYKGIYALLMRGGCEDWIEKQSIDLANFFSFSLDIHHIFPQHWCNQHDIDPSRRESIVNKTAIASRTNRIIGGNSPKKYVPTLETRAGVDAARMDGLITSHKIDPQILRNADSQNHFDAFFATRRAALLELIADAMGKGIDAESEGTEDVSDYDDEDYELNDIDDEAVT